MGAYHAKAFIAGCSGPRLTSEERGFFRTERPWGLILLKRNILEPSQVKELIADFKDAVGRVDAPILVDQEGGRVQRFGPPHWRQYPAAGQFLERTGGQIEVAKERAWLASRLMAFDLFELGVTIDCAPLLDLAWEGRTGAIGDRALASDPEAVAEIGRAIAEGLMAGGVLPVIKHLPGHGRAVVDSHETLPVVDVPEDELGRTDFLPFRRLADFPLAMTAHILFPHIDPHRPATQSAPVIERVIRTDIGFDGLLMSDDLSMKALGGDLASRTKAIFAAGCDMALHCNGLMDEMRAVASESPWLDGSARLRAERALAHRKVVPDPFDPVDAARNLVDWLAL